MKLRLEIKGAWPEEQERGIEAAEAVSRCGRHLGPVASGLRSTLASALDAATARFGFARPKGPSHWFCRGHRADGDQYILGGRH
ncbi:hypothetical protein [Mesorhizobium sp. M7A.F.Ca.MR.148.00.0.0]|uniref:hypothetical protein n=1 Tax=Mesorhizobium sp. M7A.F.Ca.MR.148.00.0.0 TaxID=2496775 RepID=UPI000FCBF3F6|nr:hypothetical protein [Mesorhizobium sp. M7A.F.Ca.MR.148.00.0.0]RUV32945.1 hypothetical protein EOB49_32555 [Mesorhizobium sp. M7A.F.Ca.MR.148.00.0.0]